MSANNVVGAQAYNRSVERADNGDRAEKSTRVARSATTDNVSISGEAELRHASFKAVENTPETRQELVAEFRQAVRNGTYQVDERKLARKLASLFS